MNHWLLKSEPDVFCYDDLVRVKREGWDGVRNFQARNFLRSMRKGDQAVFYHSNANPPGVAGICKIVKEAQPDPSQFDPTSKYYDPSSDPTDPTWSWVTVGPVRALRFIPLDELRTMPELQNCRLLARGNRLSVMPLTEEEFAAIVARGRSRKASRSVSRPDENSPELRIPRSGSGDVPDCGAASACWAEPMPRIRIICLATFVLLGASACGGVTIEVQPTTVPPTTESSTTPPSSTSTSAGTVVTGDNGGVITSGDGAVVTGSGEQLVGSGVIVTEARAVSGFHAVELRAFGEVDVTIGGTESLEVEADDNLLALVTSEVIDGRLVIGVEPGHSFINVTLRVRIGASTLDQAVLVGSADLHVDGLVSPAFDMRIEGSGTRC